MAAGNGNGIDADIRRKKARYELIRSYATLFTGIGLVVYGVWPPTDPAVFTFGGTILGANPMVRASV